jgi:hypothetical protein
MAFSTKTINGTSLTKDNFKNPPVELGILPFWFWNGEMDEKEMEWQLKEYKSKGIHGTFIHGRFGESIGYLSDTWMERVKFAVEKAKEIGIDLWIYDEMNWPSGTAYREVPKKNPKLRQKYLELVPLMVDGPLFTFLEATDDRYVNTGNSKPIAAFACSDEEYQTGIKSLIDLTPNLSFNAVIPWEAPAGKWRLLYFLEKEIDYYIDALNPESTAAFINSTHNKYKKAVGKDFGKVVPGFYTDEPAMHYYHMGLDNLVIPWTSKMFKIFRERRGYDLKPYLPALYTSMGEITSKIRYDFWRTLTEQYSESYYKQIRDWCDANGVLFTGHLLGEEWLRVHARCEGNIFKHLKHLHITGVDHLYPKIGTESEPDQHVALKLASSAAHYYSSARLLCESMGGTYWDCSLERMKWIANWEYVLGVTIFNNHGYHYSIEGERKRDWPPSQFYHHTWWKYYDQFTTYMSRLGHILSGGKHVAKVLMLYPINSIWTNYVPQSRNDIGNVIEFDFNYLTDTLLKLHFDFDYTDEDILSEAKVENGKLKIADEEFELLILPPLTHIKASAFEKIQEFVNCGGKVIADTLIPTALLEYEKDDAQQKLTDLFGKDPQGMLHNFANGATFGITHKNAKGDIYVIEGKGLNRERRKEKLNEIILKCIRPDVTISNEDVFYLHRQKDGYDIYFIANVLQEDKGEVEISFEKIGVPEIWNPNTGEIEKLNVYQIKDGRLSIALNFPPSESHIIIIRDEKPSSFITESNIQIESFDGKVISGFGNPDSNEVSVSIFKDEELVKHNLPAKKKLSEIRLDGKYKFSVEDDNVLCIANWRMKIIENSDNNLKYAETNYNDNDWLNVTLGAWEMQLPQERDEEIYPVTLWYRTSFEAEKLVKNMRLLIDGFSGTEYTLFINGKEVKSRGRRSKLDAEIKEIDIDEFLAMGKNFLAVRLIVNRRTDGILDLLKIIGDFSLKNKDDQYIIADKKTEIEIGDWTKQGYPFFSGTGVYETTFDLPKDYLDGKLFLKLSCGEDVAEVIVNNSDPIVTPWNPYMIDITNLVKAGKNTIKIKITNTLINILEAVQKESGLFKEPIIEHFNNYKITL